MTSPLAPSHPYTHHKQRPNAASLQAFSNWQRQSCSWGYWKPQDRHWGVSLEHHFCSKIWENTFILQGTRLHYWVEGKICIKKWWNSRLQRNFFLVGKGALLFQKPMWVSTGVLSRTLLWKSFSSAGPAPSLAVGLSWLGLLLPRGIAFLLIFPHVSELTACQHWCNLRVNARFQLTLFTGWNWDRDHGLRVGWRPPEKTKQDNSLWHLLWPAGEPS